MEALEGSGVPCISRDSLEHYLHVHADTVYSSVVIVPGIYSYGFDI